MMMEITALTEPGLGVCGGKERNAATEHGDFAKSPFIHKWEAMGHFD